MKQRENKNYPTKKKNNTVKGNMIMQTSDVAGLNCIEKQVAHQTQNLGVSLSCKIDAIIHEDGKQFVAGQHQTQNVIICQFIEI